VLAALMKQRCKMTRTVGLNTRGHNGTRRARRACGHHGNCRAALPAARSALAASLAFRKLREAVARAERQTAGKRLSTRIGSALGSVGKLEWAASCGMPLSAKLLSRVAWLGQLEPLRWLRAHGCAWEPCDPESESPCSSAAEGGHLSVLQWARANGCPWDADTCTYSAYGGHLAVLQWARANGCPWNADTCMCAAEGGHLAVLQ
jgi:hypothetical protein